METLRVKFKKKKKKVLQRRIASGHEFVNVQIQIVIWSEGGEGGVEVSDDCGFIEGYTVRHN